MVIGKHRRGSMNRSTFCENARLTAESNVDNVRFGYRLVLWWKREAAKYRYMSFDAVEPEKEKCVVTLRNCNVTADINVNCD
jgi:hypothetical protein